MIGFTNFQNTLSLFKTLFYLNEENEIIDSQFNIVVFMKHTLLRGFEFRQLLLHTHDNTRTPKAPAVGQSIDWLPIIANKPHNSIRVNLSPLAYLYKRKIRCEVKWLVDHQMMFEWIVRFYRIFRRQNYADYHTKKKSIANANDYPNGSQYQLFIVRWTCSMKFGINIVL